MSRRPRDNDISIGKDAWITFGDLAGGQARAVQIDQLLAPVMPFIESLETECVAECCGIDAFLLWPEEVARAATKHDCRELESLSINLASVQREVAGLASDTVVSTRLNNYFRKVVFLEVQAHIHKAIESVRHERDVKRG